jgi:hypothetical protein
MGDKVEDSELTEYVKVYINYTVYTLKVKHCKT